MALLYDFLTSFNLFFLLLCIIGLFWSINLVIDYYAPTSTSFVNMYFSYYIFFTTTLLAAVGCSNYIEMDSPINPNSINETGIKGPGIELKDMSSSSREVAPLEMRGPNGNSMIAPNMVVNPLNAIPAASVIVP
jgi:hypothetical protein